MSESESNLSSVGRQFRQHAGLPERESDEPITSADNETSQIVTTTEPEGGYGNPDEVEEGQGEAPSVDTSEVPDVGVGAPTNTQTVEADGQDIEGHEL